MVSDEWYCFPPNVAIAVINPTNADFTKLSAEQIGNTSSEMLTDNGNNTITVTMEPGSDQQTITVNGQQTGQQHVLTTNSDGSLSISGLPGHIIGSLGNVSSLWISLRTYHSFSSHFLGYNHPNWRWAANWVWSIDHNARAFAPNFNGRGLSCRHDSLSYRRASRSNAIELSRQFAQWTKERAANLTL